MMSFPPYLSHTRVLLVLHSSSQVHLNKVISSHWQYIGWGHCSNGPARLTSFWALVWVSELEEENGVKHRIRS
jgi:hypothetical protein